MPLVGVLVSCGGEGDQAPQPQTREVELRIIDGYLHRASVWLDSNGNGKIDPGEPQTRSDEQGRARLSMPAQAVGMVMARAIAGQTRDLDEPDRTVARDFLMMAPADSRLVTPFTTYLALQQREGRSPEEALSRLRHELTQPSLDPTQDYVARPEPVIAASARALAQLLPATAQQLTEQGGMLLSQGASAIGADLLNQQQSGQSIVTGHWHFTVQEGAPVLGARDRDGDGTLDADDAFPDDKSESQDSDKDGIGDNADPDDDNDGWPDADELRLGSDPLSATSHPAEQGGNNNGVDPLPDETGQSQLPDQDGDGVPDQQDAFPLDRFETRDSNGDGWGDRASSDDDGDGIPDSQDPTPTGSTAQVPHYDEAVIHYRRVDGNYDGWGIHLWNDPRCDSVVTSTGWAQPQAPVGGAGPDGIAFRIPIKPGHGACVNFLIHKGEVRAWGGDGNLDLSRGNVAYTFDGNPSLYYQPQRELPVAVTGAAAHWLSLDTLAWSAPPGADHYELWAGEGELAQPERFQRLVLGAGGQLTDERFPHLKGRSRFTLSATAEQARAMLKQSLLAVAVDAEGKAMAATQVQTP
ncbi:Pullulanase, partial [Aeromonas diversa CDC 2478-85]